MCVVTCLCMLRVYGACVCVLPRVLYMCMWPCLCVCSGEKRVKVRKTHLEMRSHPIGL